MGAPLLPHGSGLGHGALHRNGPLESEDVEVVEGPGGPLWTVSSGTGPVGLVLCHGGPGMSDNLGPMADMVSDLVRVHRFDQRACGRSGGSCEGLDLESAIGDIESLREHWGYAHWIVGGHSWGAALALFYALAHLDRVDGLIYVAGVGVGTESRLGIVREQQRARRRRIERLGPELGAEMKRLASSEDPDDQQRFCELLWLSDFADPSRAPDSTTEPLFAYPQNRLAAKLLGASATRRSAEPGFPGELAHFPVPTLVLHGEEDPVPIEGAERLAGIFPRAQMVRLAGVGHDVWLEDPVAVAAALRAFVGPLAGHRSLDPVGTTRPGT